MMLSNFTQKYSLLSFLYCSLLSSSNIEILNHVDILVYFILRINMHNTIFKSFFFKKWSKRFVIIYNFHCVFLAFLPQHYFILRINTHTYNLQVILFQEMVIKICHYLQFSLCVPCFPPATLFYPSHKYAYIQSSGHSFSRNGHKDLSLFTIFIVCSLLSSSNIILSFA